MAQDVPFEPTKVPLREGSMSFESRLPDEAVDFYGLEGGSPIGWQPRLDGSAIVLDIHTATVDESLSTTTRVRQSGETTTWYGRPPRPMAESLGLGRLVEIGAEGIIEYVDDTTMRMRTAPAMTPWMPSGTPPLAVQQLDPVEKPLYAIRNPERRDDPMQFRFDFGVDYADAYELEKGQEIAIHYGAVDGELALMLDFAPEPGEGYRRTIQTHWSGTQNTKTLVHAVYPHKAHVQSLGIGTEPLVDDENPGIRVRVTPKTNAVGLRPGIGAEDGDLVDDVQQETTAPA